MNGKQLLLIGFLLLALILSVPVSGTSWEDITRVNAGTSTPTGIYAWGNSTVHTVLGTTGSDATTLVRAGYCCDHQVRGNLRIDVPPYTVVAGCEDWLSSISTTDNGNGTTTYSLSTAFLPEGVSPWGGKCVAGNYYGIEGYKSVAAYGGDLTTVSYTEYEIRPLGYVTAGTVDFTSDVVSGNAPLTVNFQDISSFAPTMVNYWDYGDGNTYTAPSTYMTTAQHSYTSAGWYDVKHLAFDLSGHYGWANKTSYIEVLSSGNGTVSGYTMFVNPETVIYNNNFTITTTSDSGKFNGITNIKFGYTKGSESNILDSADGNILDYVNTSGTWYQFNTNTHAYDIALSGVPSSIINIPAKMGSGTYTIDGYITKTNNQVVHLTDTLIISTDNQQTLSIHAIDFNDGYIVSTARIKVLDISHNTWDNRSIGGDKVFYYPYGQKLYINVNSSVYYDSFKNYTVTSAPTNLVEVVMYRGINTPAGNVTLRVNVMDTLGGYLNNAKVTVLNDDAYFDSQSKYTNYAGIATFTVLPSTDYVISVSKTGYLSAGKLVNSGSGGLTLDTTIVLSVGSNPTVTTTPPTPVPTPIGGNITPVSCQTTLPTGATLLDTLRNNMACAGISSGQNQGFGIALMIIFTLGIIGGKYGKGMGVVMGMSAGYVLSLAMGLVPLWTFIALLVFICLILAIKIWSSDK